MIIHTGIPESDPGPYERDRRCAHEHDGIRCITRLHSNNPGPYCERHTTVPDPPAVCVARLEYEAA